MAAGVRALLRLMARWCGYASASFLTAMMLITVADVSSRALFNAPITGAYDLVQLFLVGTVFLEHSRRVPARRKHRRSTSSITFAGRTAVDLLKVFANLAGLVFLAVLSWRMVRRRWIRCDSTKTRRIFRSR